jgi:hypothetical protein
METVLMKTANFGIGTYLSTKETIFGMLENVGKGFDQIVQKGSTDKGETAENARKVVADVSSAFDQVQSKVDSFVAEIKTRFES